MRLSGTGGDPVVQLQTNFGGGKTHSLLALYHLFSGKIKPGDVTGIENVSAQTKGLPDKLPVANRAVLACNYLSVDTPWKKSDGTVIRTPLCVYNRETIVANNLVSRAQEKRE